MSLTHLLHSKLPLKLQVEEAYALKEQLIAGAKAALKATEDKALFGESWHSTTPLDRLKSELSKDFSGDALYKQLLKKITTLENAEHVVMLEDGIKAIARTDLEGVCFTGETKVIVENGELEDIQYIDAGRLVLSRCEKTGETAYRKVIRNLYREVVPTYELWTYWYDEEGDYNSFGPITATVEHPFWVKGKGWVPLSELQPGDALVSSECPHDIFVREIKFFYPGSCVHNLEVEEFNTFFVTEVGIWVHNCNTNGARVWELLPQKQRGQSHLPHSAQCT